MTVASTATHHSPVRRRITALLAMLFPDRAGKRPAPGAGTPLVAEFDALLLSAADAAVSRARRALYDVTWHQLAPGERLAARGEVTVEDVAEIMQLTHGGAFIPPGRIAAALRYAFEAREGHIDLTTDAYNS